MDGFRSRVRNLLKALRGDRGRRAGIRDLGSGPRPRTVILRERVYRINLEFSQRNARRFWEAHKRWIVAGCAVLAVVLGTKFFLIGFASTVDFYPSSCLGSWENVANALGKPDLSPGSPGSSFTGLNSAVFSTSSAQMFCGNFSGDTNIADLENKNFQSATLVLSWYVALPDAPSVGAGGGSGSGTAIIGEGGVDAGSMGSSTATSTDASVSDASGTEDLLDASSSDAGLSATTSAAAATVADGSGPRDTSIATTTVDAGESATTTMTATTTPGSDLSLASSSSSTDMGDFLAGENAATDTATTSDEVVATSTTPVVSAGPATTTTATAPPATTTAATNEAAATTTPATTTGDAETTSSTASDGSQPSPPASPPPTPPPSPPSPPPDNTSSSSSPSSWLPRFFSVAFADEIVPADSSTDPSISPSSTDGVLVPPPTSTVSLASSTTEGVPSTSTTPAPMLINTSVFQNIILPASEPGDFLGIVYSTDGVTWQPVGDVNAGNWQAGRFSVPISSWDELQHLQIAFVGLGTPGAPTIYLDAADIEVNYEDTPEATTFIASSTPPAPADQSGNMSNVPDQTANPSVPQEGLLQAAPVSQTDVFEQGARQQCVAAPFSVTVSRGSTAALSLELFSGLTTPSGTAPSSTTSGTAAAQNGTATSALPYGYEHAQYDTRLGSLPPGIFASIDSVYASDASSTETIHISANYGAQVGSYSILVIYRERQDDASLRSTGCQLNLVVR